MFPNVLIVMIAATTVLAAQGGARETPLPPIGGPQTPFEQFARRLDLDRKTQFVEAERLFTEAAREAPPIAQQMQQLRIRLVNAEIDNSDAEIRAVLAEYRVVAARMAELEARTFARVYALLRPNQAARATEAFAIIAGLFVPPPPASARVPRR